MSYHLKSEYLLVMGTHCTTLVYYTDTFVI